MGCGDQLWALLRPLGPYRQRGIYSGGALDSEGSALDGVQDELELLEREALLDTAESFGLDRLESMLATPPVTSTPEGRRKALMALLRIGGDSFTLSAINNNLKGCGLNAEVSETNQPGLVEVRFPDESGVPHSFEDLKSIIEEILPCHLEIRYVFWCITWAKLEDRFLDWNSLEFQHYSWETLEGLVRNQT